ncbi:MAG: aminotransferase class I/II-fold pyridoxal phosphate-dependent enzyme [Planctomycetes bacterium]|nr:aminotransferase class I/II-fold pyridoxal phosphate-dependent enzyme [Planctomycetota bacterium]
MSIAYSPSLPAPSFVPPNPQVEMTEETSLVDLFRARERGVGFREAAAMFKQMIVHFEAIGQNLYGRTLLGPNDAEALVDYPRESGQRQMIILASNNYLGLNNHPRVIAAAQQAALDYGTGAGSSPLLLGRFPVTKEVESKLAALKGAEEACVFATGYSANVGVISAVAGKDDVVVLDRLAHASMVDGAKLSGAQMKVFHHNDAAHLDNVLRRNRQARVKLVAVEGIYSMDGDVAPLDELYAVCRQHDALLMVDEAHSTGVLGAHGRGAAELFGLEGKIDLHVGTLSKALGACGGFVAGNSDLVTYIRYFARSGMFSTAPSPMVLAAASAAIDVIRDEPELRHRLWDNCRFMHSELKRLGFTVNEAPSPVIPLIVGTMKRLRQMTLELHRNNICVNSVPFPAVPHGSERLRISLTASHTREQLVEAIECIRRAGVNAGII